MELSLDQKPSLNLYRYVLPFTVVVCRGIVFAKDSEKLGCNIFGNPNEKRPIFFLLVGLVGATNNDVVAQVCAVLLSGEAFVKV